MPDFGIGHILFVLSLPFVAGLGIGWVIWGL